MLIVKKICQHKIQLSLKHNKIPNNQTVKEYSFCVNNSDYKSKESKSSMNKLILKNKNLKDWKMSIVKKCKKCIKRYTLRVKETHF